MSEQKTEQTETVKTAGTTPAAAAQTGADTNKTTSSRPAGRGGFGGHGGARRPGGKPGFRKGSRFGNRPKPEFEQKIINISRVTRVVKGGRRLSFRVDMIIGDKKGRVGLGSGKATDTSLAIQKAFNVARKNLIYLKLTKNKSIPFASSAKVTSSRVEMMPNKERGLVAGSTMRNVLEIAGVTDVTAKVQSRSKNKLNNAKAAIEALKAFELPLDERKALIAKLAIARQKEMGRGDRRGGNRRGGPRRGGPGGRKPFNRAPRAATNTK
ncbi:MAG: ribosomal protein S5 [Minisyncoccia bacterium]